MANGDVLATASGQFLTAAGRALAPWTSMKETHQRVPRYVMTRAEMSDNLSAARRQAGFDDVLSAWLLPFKKARRSAPPCWAGLRVAGHRAES
jgi:hypothetical protein